MMRAMCRLGAGIGIALWLACAAAQAQAWPDDDADGAMAPADDPWAMADGVAGDTAADADDEADAQRAQSAAQAYYARIAADLAASGQPRELAFAALLLQLARAAPASAGMEADAPSQAAPRDPRITQWRQLASARAGSDVLANQLLLAADAPDEAAVRDAAARRWRTVEPGNLAPWLFAGSDPDAVLAAAAAATRDDRHWLALLRWIDAALQAHPPSAGERAAMGGNDAPDAGATAAWASGLAAAIAMPALRPLMDACRERARAAACRTAGEVMAGASDTGLGTSFGIALLQATAADPAQRADAEARGRTLDWRMWQWGALAARQPDEGAAQFARLLHDPAIDSENALVERVLEEAGVALQPPAGWQPPRPPR